MSDSLEILSTAGPPPCHIQWMKKGSERINVTISALTESALAALALENLQCLLPQLASKRHGQSKMQAFCPALRFCLLSPKTERTGK